MAVTVADLQTQFPEFARTAPALLMAKLRDAQAMTAVDYPEAQRDLRIKYLAAELLVQSPAGEFARLNSAKEPDGVSSIYERQRIAIDRGNAGPMVL